MKRLITLISTVMLSTLVISAKSPDQTIKSTFDFKLEKYLGTWYEIARFDHSFERGLEGATANYSLMDNGKIKVVNSGYKNGLDGKFKTAVGKAKLTSPDTPRNLKVSFFLFFYSPYNILELDENYQYVLIGSNSSNYLWILSRTPEMDDKVYKSLLEKAKNRGYDVSKLIKVTHKK
ncbi:MAG: lipocalin family protein [Prolixibacteraceae bacterium]|nr:lipocalin family protein [Prolixibacteraceae bacterium]